MIWCQLRARAQAGERVRVGDVAQVIGSARAAEAVVCRLPGEGVWRVTALQTARALEQVCPGERIMMLGAEACCVHCQMRVRRDPWRWLRTWIAFLLLTAGSALGLCWFHADVNMPDAQLAVYRLVTGAEPADPRWITVPYAAGVVIGAAIFYALPWQKTITPMEVRMEEYRADMEATVARDAEDAGDG